MKEDGDPGRRMKSS